MVDIYINVMDGIWGVFVRLESIMSIEKEHGV